MADFYASGDILVRDNGAGAASPVVKQVSVIDMTAAELAQVGTKPAGHPARVALDRLKAQGLQPAGGVPPSQLGRSNRSTMLRLCGGKGTSTGGVDVRTSFLKVQSDAAFDAVRIIITGRETVQSTGWKFVAAPTSTAKQNGASAEKFDPTPNGVTFYTALADAANPLAWRAGTFAGAATGTLAAAAALAPTHLKSDIVPCKSVPRTDGGAGYLAMFRIYHDGATTGSHSLVSGFQNAGGWVDNVALPYYLETQYGTSATDAVGTLATKPGSFAGTGFHVTVEFFLQGQKQGRTLMTCGDSITEANSTQLPTLIFGASALRAVKLVSTEDAPIGYVNFAFSGETSTTYTGAILNALPVFLPTDLLFSGFSPNDGVVSQFLLDAMRVRILRVMEACRQYGIKLHLQTGIPNETYAQAQDDLRKAHNAWIRSLCAAGDAVLWDYDAAVTNGATPARYLSGVKFDNVHVNTYGMDLGAVVGAAALRQSW